MKYELKPLGREHYTALDKAFQTHTGCPINTWQTNGDPNQLERLKYIKEPKILTIAGVPIAFHVEEHPDSQKAHRKGYAMFTDQQCREFLMTFRHVEENRQIGHDPLNEVMEQWDTSGEWHELQGDKDWMHRFVHTVSFVKGEQSILYSCRTLGEYAGAIPYSFFLFTQSAKERSLRLVLGRTFKLKEGMVIEPYDYQKNRQRTEGTEVKDDIQLSVDFLQQQATVKIGRRSQTSAQEIKHSLTETPLRLTLLPTPFTDGTPANILVHPVRVAIEKGKTITCACASDGLIDWHLNGFPVLSAPSEGMAEAVLFSWQLDQWKRSMEHLQASGEALRF